VVPFSAFALCKFSAAATAAAAAAAEEEAVLCNAVQ